MDEHDLDTQWTAQARDHYIANSRRLVEALEAHVALTLAREGRQAEISPYFESVDNVQAAAAAFNEAEMDWCGSVALRGASDVDDDWDDEDDGSDDDTSVPGAVLSLSGRWDYTVVDESVLVQRGRDAYLETWPDDIPEDANIAVTDAVGAIRELLHNAGPQVLESVDGLEPRGFWMNVRVLPADLDDLDDEDPFSYRVRGVPVDEARLASGAPESQGD